MIQLAKGEMVAPSKIIEHFTSELRERLGEKILGIYLFGSSAKDTATEQSDIDLLVVYSDMEEWNPRYRVSL